MVWVYGGGNVAGATNLPSYDAANFARDGVVLVAMNYRLGPLGFFAHPALTAEAGKAQPLVSYGLMDQIAALKWVKRNIAAFGGDPGNVTLFGESAGGVDVLQLMATPSARGLFQKAIVQSGGGWFPLDSLKAAERRGAALATRLGLPAANATAAQLRAVPAADLIATGEGAIQAIDGRLISEDTASAFAKGEEIPAPLIIGAAYAADSANDETLARALFNDSFMAAPARWIAAKASARAPAWLYYFSYVPERQRLIRPGTNHASEIPFVFDSLDAVPGRKPLITPSERAEAALAHACWVAFARLGRPDCGHGVVWPAYSPATDQLLEFGDPPAVRVHFRKTQLDAQEAARGAPIAGP
jgi:para-nitrobenzyl esterase